MNRLCFHFCMIRTILVFYTGNGRIARIISTAAAKHLTPLTLELGGKSPVIIDPNYDMELAAKRVLYGKINNSGQVSGLLCSPRLLPSTELYALNVSPRSASPPTSFSSLVQNRMNLSLPSKSTMTHSFRRVHSRPMRTPQLLTTFTSNACRMCWLKRRVRLCSAERPKEGASNRQLWQMCNTMMC